eukprot:1138666-Pelagomonas_calceolata.AAC.2
MLLRGWPLHSPRISAAVSHEWDGCSHGQPLKLGERFLASGANHVRLLWNNNLQAGQLRVAEALFQSADVPDAITYEAFIAACGIAGAPDKVGYAAWHCSAQALFGPA